jgi:hypothetical protein
MSGYSLTTSAQADVRSIRRYYRREAGYGIARQMSAEFVSAFRAIAGNPGIGHKREDLAGDRAILVLAGEGLPNFVPRGGIVRNHSHGRAREPRHRSAYSASRTVK